MSDRPAFLIQGERARLFPVLAENSKEGRTLSILLSCMENVQEFGRSMLADFGLRIGARAKIETYTEVVLKNSGSKKFRPDGLIVVRSGSKTWHALVEAKVGKNELSNEQVESYLEIAKMNGVDAVLTISNQFAPLPSHHPLDLSFQSLRKAQLFHWSWKYVLTIATLLLKREEVSDDDQKVILNEMVRFLTHPSAGVKSFDQMPSQWTAVLESVHAGGEISPKSSDVQDVIGAWHQEIRDLCLVLSRQLNENVDIRVPRPHLKDPMARLKSDAEKLAETYKLYADFVIPNAVSQVSVAADFGKRSIYASMRVAAPGDRKSTKARLNWLLRQLKESVPDNIHIKLIWPGRGQNTLFSLVDLQKDSSVADLQGKVATSFEVIYAKDLAARFGQRKTFIVELERAVPAFYEQVGQNLKNWQAPAPRISDDKAEPRSVNTDSLSADAERFVEEAD
ncbi:hypothetical protein [Nisaea sp.]|uniref:hypothetical protein n=1 Tax=Nisaea sp. TaxID=2024842 RepID=UPI0032F0974C